MYRVGLTGNIASGKSAVARIWRGLGAHIIDADVLAREAVEPGSPALQRIAATFGQRILAQDGSLDRAALRTIVFADPSARARLESIVHPVVQQLREQAERELVERGVALVVHEIPLLFETGMEDEFDAVVFVEAAVSTRRRRLIDARGLTGAEADSMIDAQMDASAKRPLADHVIRNDGSLEELVERASLVWAELKEAAA